MLRLLTIAARRFRARMTERILHYRILYRNPTLACDPSVLWDYAFSAPDSIQLGQNVSVRAFCEIVVYRRTRLSTVEGKLTIGDGAVSSTGANIRAAGGQISVGAGTAIGQHCVLVAANHTVAPDQPYLNTQWNEKVTGIDIAENVWIGANCVILPGARIGANSVIAAGSLVNREVPPNEMWGGYPARRIQVIA